MYDMNTSKGEYSSCREVFVGRRRRVGRSGVVQPAAIRGAQAGRDKTERFKLQGQMHIILSCAFQNGYGDVTMKACNNQAASDASAQCYGHIASRNTIVWLFIYCLWALSRSSHKKINIVT